ncbi:MAG: hypothetical protein JWO14_3032 [Solirubrobacterales bacterium]|nr:hypothetical protein [Solirubrobacterales bacterium]
MPNPSIRILFLHHSVGRYLIRDGELRRRLSALRVDDRPLVLWDHDYNQRGIHDGEGRPLGRAFPLPGDDTDPPGLLNLFAGEDEAARLARRQALDFEVVMLKSCYPNSAIRSETELARIKEVYRRLLTALADHPDNQFLLLTSPPLVPLRTNRRQSRCARRLSIWLVRGVDLPPNVAVFDLFDRLAIPERTGARADRLRKRYRRRLPVDSHPNVRAGEEVAADLLAAIAGAAARSRWTVRTGD